MQLEFFIITYYKTATHCGSNIKSTWREQDRKSERHLDSKSERHQDSKSERQPNSKSERHQDSKSERHQDSKSERHQDSKSERQPDSKSERQPIGIRTAKLICMRNCSPAARVTWKAPGQVPDRSRTGPVPDGKSCQEGWNFHKGRIRLLHHKETTGSSDTKSHTTRRGSTCVA